MTQTEKLETSPGAPTTSRPSSAIFFILCFVPALGTVLFGAVDQVTWALFSVIWTVVALLWSVDSWQRGGLVFNASNLLVPLLGLVLIGALQLMPVRSVVSIDTASTFYFEVQLVILLTFFAGYLTWINSEVRLRRVVNFVVIFGSAMAFFGILQRLANPDGIYGVRATPASIPFGPFVNQHHFAGFMEMTGGLTMGMLFGSTTVRERRILLAVAAMIMGTAVAFTGSRGGLLSFGAVLAFALLFRFLEGRTTSGAGKRRQLAVMAGGLGLIAFTFLLVLSLGGNDSLSRGTGLVAAGDDVSSGRYYFWTIALQIFTAHPILGTGLDSFATAFTQYDTLPGIFRVERAHNEYLQTLADAGVLGIACVLGFVVLLFRQALRVITSTDGYRRYVATGALAGCFGIIIHSFFDFPLRTYSNAFFFLMLAALATVTVAIEQPLHRPQRRQRHRSEAT